jgi:type I restriction enzyme R subunit
MKPEDRARARIDGMLTAAGWAMQDRAALNLAAARGVAVRYFPLLGGDEADYLLFVDHRAVGVVEAKAEGTKLSGVAEQSGNYIAELPPDIPHA